MTLGHEKLDVYGAIRLKKSAQSSKLMRSIPIAISIPMKKNLNKTVEATLKGVLHF